QDRAAVRREVLVEGGAAVQQVADLEEQDVLDAELLLQAEVRGQEAPLRAVPAPGQVDAVSAPDVVDRDEAAPALPVQVVEADPADPVREERQLAAHQGARLLEAAEDPRRHGGG